jgi:hypothetical protein
MSARKLTQRPRRSDELGELALRRTLVEAAARQRDP